MTLLHGFKQWFCSHTVYIEDIERIDPDKARVKAPCNKCGRVLYAAYGLCLDAQLQRKPQQ